MSVENVTIKRVSGFSEADEATSPVWWRTADGTVLISCGECGMPIGIREWDIADNGVVSPSILHELPPCGWHVFAHLLEWDKE